MSIVESFSKRTIILLIVLVAIGGAAAAYLLYFKEAGIFQLPEPEKIAKRIKIEAPPEAKKETPAPGGQQPAPQAQAQPAEKAPQQPAETKPEAKKKEEAKPAVKEAAPEKKAEVKKTGVRGHGLGAEKTRYKTWAVHVASYATKEEAEAIIKKLKQDNYNTYMTEFNLKGRHWYRVRIGFYSSKQEADDIGKKLSSNYNINSAWSVKPLKTEVKKHSN